MIEAERRLVELLARVTYERLRDSVPGVEAEAPMRAIAEEAG
jgi:hypothetical protein